MAGNRRGSLQTRGPAFLASAVVCSGGWSRWPLPAFGGCKPQSELRSELGDAGGLCSLSFWRIRGLTRDCERLLGLLAWKTLVGFRARVWLMTKDARSCRDTTASCPSFRQPLSQTAAFS